MQAIQVKFIGPSNYRPSRWRVFCAARSRIVSKGHYCDTNDNMDARLAAEALAKELGWDSYGDMIEGSLPNGDRVFVFPEPSLQPGSLYLTSRCR